jgi:hypothetical protein
VAVIEGFNEEKTKIMKYISVIFSIVFCATAQAELTGTGPRLRPEDRIDQEQIVDGTLSLTEIREAGLKVFATPFNRADGLGDGTHDPLVPDTRDFTQGNRPTLQGNGTFLRVNGMDSQTCLECHSFVSNAEVPARLGVGGVGGINNSALFQPDRIDVTGENFNGIAEFSGRLINPPFLFGSGGVELLAREMTADLQALKQEALVQPGTPIELVTKGVSFGEIVADEAGGLDTSQVQGIDGDLVVRPFGRKGDMASIREFSVNALAFHLGMQAIEAFEYPDEDNDGIRNEISIGDLSALSIFISTMDRPEQKKRNIESRHGARLFSDIGCADCHRPELTTEGKYLYYKLTGSPQKPFEDTFYYVDLTLSPMDFQKARGGVKVGLFSDLKRHDMGEGLKESFSKATDQENREFITPRLWGIADTAPYLHDGRALTLVEAIEWHDSDGSEAAGSAQAFSVLQERDKNRLIKFLLTLRTPRKPNADVVGD